MAPHVPDFTCGMCAHWHGGRCHNPDSAYANAIRKGGNEACEYYTGEFHGTGWFIKDWILHHKAVVALGVAVLVFLGIWFATGDVWAAIILFEVIFDILMEMDF